MMAVFFVFGLNIFQFINLNMSSTNQLDRPKIYSIQGENPIDTESAQLAALALAQARDGALVDGSLLKNQIVVNSRHLLSDTDYDDSEKSPRREVINSTTNKSNSTWDRVNGMDLVLINGTWHVIDLSICQSMISNQTHKTNDQYFNITHFNRINNELDGWYRRHLIRNPLFNKPASAGNGGDYERHMSTLLKNLRNQPADSSDMTKSAGANDKIRPRFIEEARDRAKNVRRTEQEHPIQEKKEYPISLYDTQTQKHEDFANSVRQRNDTFYFVSFRRDHVMYPATKQNRSERPRMSLLMPAMLATNLNSSQKQQTIAFMQIDCEVVDTHLIHFKLNEIPMSYLKIIHQEYMSNSDSAKEFF